MSKIYKFTNLRKSRFSKIAAFWSLGIIGNGCFLGGGALRTLIEDEEVADFDLFFEVDQSEPILPSYFHPDLYPNYVAPHTRVEEVKAILRKEKFDCVFACPIGSLFSYKKGNMKVQLILHDFGSPEEIIRKFDISACQAAFDGVNFFCSTNFVRNIKTKRLTLESVTYPVATIKRLSKYEKKGYNISKAAQQFMKFVEGNVYDNDQLRIYID
jgi:hypothetical protein